MSADAATETSLDIAADWFARRRSGQMTMQELLELEVWLESDPAHLDAFKSVVNAWSLTQAVASNPELLALREGTKGSFIGRRAVVVGGVLVASLVLAVALVGTGALGLWKDWTTPVTDEHFQTAIGQTRTVTLVDGSTAMLDSNSAIDAHETWRRREIHLIRGQAYFHVAKDSARPFSVLARGNTVTATGTTFDVRIDDQKLFVLLTEGRLHVEMPETTARPAEQTEMTAGHLLVAWSNGETSLTRIGAESQTRALSWQTGHLAFVHTPLSSVAAELNRYSAKQLIVLPSVGDVQIDGTFVAGNIDGFVKLLLKGHLARVQKDTNLAITLTKRK